MSSRTNLPPLTRGLVLGLLVTTLINAGARYRSWAADGSEFVGSMVYYPPYITLIPSTSIIYPWTFCSATFAEQNIFGLIITGATLLYGGRYLERAWSSRELTKFILLISFVPNFLTFTTYITIFALTKQEKVITTAVSGGIAIQAAFLVSFKQLVPEHNIMLFRGAVSARVKHFPAVFLLANSISGVTFGTHTAMLLAWIGFFTSWIYLRFYRLAPAMLTTATGDDVSTGFATLPGGTIRGDASDTFAFACFFPDPVQPPIAAVSDTLYKLLVYLHICTRFTSADIAASNNQASFEDDGPIMPSLLHGERGIAPRSEAERRRALALKALDERLHTHQMRSTLNLRTESELEIARIDSGSEDDNDNSVKNLPADTIKFMT